MSVKKLTASRRARAMNLARLLENATTVSALRMIGTSILKEAAEAMLDEDEKPKHVRSEDNDSFWRVWP